MVVEKNKTVVGKEDVFIVPEGEVYEGDIVVMGGVLLVKGTIKGNVASLRGKVKISGHIDGSLAALYSKVILSGYVKNVAILYSELIVDGGHYDNIAIMASWGDVLRPAKVKNIAIKNDPFTFLSFGLLLGYALSFL